MLKLSTVVSVLLATIQISWAQSYPLRPDPSLTPGSLCLNQDRFRYPEQIKYCERNVQVETKWRVISIYDAKYGYSIARDRNSYKIDHYIPLCMGGSNEIRNLWPQHRNVYMKTDPLEGLLCEKLKYGRVKQMDAIQLIKRAKADLNQVRAIINYVNGL